MPREAVNIELNVEYMAEIDGQFVGNAQSMQLGDVGIKQIG